MEAHAVEAVIAAGAEDLSPEFDVGRGVARQRKIAAIVGPSQVGDATVDHEILAPGAELAQAEGELAAILGPAAGQAQGEVLQDRMEFIPEHGLGPERDLELDVTAAPIPGGRMRNASS